MSYVNWAIALLFILLGIQDMRSNKPTGIYSNVKPPKMNKIKDLKAYNRAVGRMIIGFAMLFVAEGFAALFISEKAAGILLAATAFPGAIAMMIIYEVVISPKYINTKQDL
jgi:hypothetical protein